MRCWLASLAICAALVAVPAQVRAEEARDGAVAASASNLQTGLALAAFRFAVPAQKAAVPQWQVSEYGPFRVVAPDRVKMVGATDSATPAQFAAMLRDHPGLQRMDMVRCPGTHDDIANLKLGRMIRAAGLATHVPANGSVRSGAVDLFLAGRERVIEEGAEFAVHSWQDRFGREADDFAPDAGPNRAYLDYYRAMGLDGASAAAFYAFTNSVPHSEALWLEADEMRGWLARLERQEHQARPVLASAGPAVVITGGQLRINHQALALLDPHLLDRLGRATSGPAAGSLDFSRHL